jgi:hypothetical protein
MKKINIDVLARQSFTYLLDNGNEVIFELYYSYFTKAWYTTITYTYKDTSDTDTTKVKKWDNLQLVINDNLLSQYVNVIPFGLAITGDYNPLFIDDFESGKNEFIILEAEDL